MHLTEQAGERIELSSCRYRLTEESHHRGPVEPTRDRAQVSTSSSSDRDFETKAQTPLLLMLCHQTAIGTDIQRSGLTDSGEHRFIVAVGGLATACAQASGELMSTYARNNK